MLVLSRQKDETIMIGDEVEITVVDIRGDKVRLGINAPRTVQVHRKEVYEAIRRENTAAASMRIEDVADLPRPRPALDRTEALRADTPAARINPGSAPRAAARRRPA